jgi:hypothetical protein
LWCHRPGSSLFAHSGPPEEAKYEVELWFAGDELFEYEKLAY